MSMNLLNCFHDGPYTRYLATGKICAHLEFIKAKDKRE